MYAVLINSAFPIFSKRGGVHNPALAGNSEYSTLIIKSELNNLTLKSFVYNM